MVVPKRTINSALGRRDLEDPRSFGSEHSASQHDRGREVERGGLNPRSSSTSSVKAAYRSSSRQSLRGSSQTPTSPSDSPPFDTSKGHRLATLNSNNNRRWTLLKRVATASRGKADVGRHGRAFSDSDRTPEHVGARQPTAVARQPIAITHGKGTTLGLVRDRRDASSTAVHKTAERSKMTERDNPGSRENMHLDQQLADEEDTPQNKMMDREGKLAETQSLLEEARSELRTNMAQIATLESKIAKQQSSLENAHSVYASLQKQYSEQCTDSERYLDQLRQREQDIKDNHNHFLLRSLEDSEHITHLEKRIAHLERGLSKEDVLPPRVALRRRRVRGYDAGQLDGSSSADEAEHSRRDQAFREFLSTGGESLLSWQTWLNGPVWISPSLLPQYIATRLRTWISADMAEPLHNAISPYQLMQDATVDSDWEAILSKLLTEWYYVGASLIAIAALYAAVFGFASSTIFPIDGSARRAVAFGATAAGMGIVSNLWLIFLYGRLDPASFKRKVVDIFGSYYFFCLTARLPAFFLALASFALMVFLVVVAWLTWRVPVIGLGIFTTAVLVLQYLAFVAQSTFVLLGKALASAYEMVCWAYERAVDLLSLGNNPNPTISLDHHLHGQQTATNAAPTNMPPAPPSAVCTS